MNASPGGRPGSPSLSAEQAEALLASARSVLTNAYAPYSGFRVGAALLGSDERVHTGVNIENAVCGLTVCAERNALAAAIGVGAGGFRAIAVAGSNQGRPCMPCGSCRQVLHELARDIIVVVEDEGGPMMIGLRELLPNAFGPESITPFGG